MTTASVTQAQVISTRVSFLVEVEAFNKATVSKQFPRNLGFIKVFGFLFWKRWIKPKRIRNKQAHAAKLQSRPGFITSRKTH